MTSNDAPAKLRKIPKIHCHKKGVKPQNMPQISNFLLLPTK